MRTAQFATYALMFPWLFIAIPGSGGEWVPDSDSEDKVFECIAKIDAMLAPALAGTQNFESTEEMAAWLVAHMPTPARVRFQEAGNELSRTLDLWKTHGMIQGPFWNMQALSELLIAQSQKFDGVAKCDLGDSIGVTREILVDRIYVAADLGRNELSRSLSPLGLSDSYYVRKAVYFGVVLRAAGISWTEQQFTKLMKFQIDNDDCDQWIKGVDQRGQ